MKRTISDRFRLLGQEGVAVGSRRIRTGAADRFEGAAAFSAVATAMRTWGFIGIIVSLNTRAETGFPRLSSISIR